MSQITRTAEVKPITSTESYGRAITVGLAATAAIIVVAFLLTRPMAAIPAQGAGADQLTDGFLPGAIAAHAAQQVRNAQALSDGWEAQPRWTNARRSERCSRRVGGWPGRRIATTRTSARRVGGRAGAAGVIGQRHHRRLGVVPLQVGTRDGRDAGRSQRPASCYVPAARSARAWTSSRRACSSASRGLIRSRSPTSSTAPSKTRSRPNGSATIILSHRFVSLNGGREAMAQGWIGRPDSRATMTTPGFATRYGPNGPSQLTTRTWPGAPERRHLACHGRGLGPGAPSPRRAGSPPWRRRSGAWCSSRSRGSRAC